MTLVYDEDIQSRKIFVGGLADSTDDMSFVKYFQKFGEICDSIVMFDKITGKPKRFGFVVFSKVSALENCLDQCPHVVDGAEVNVKKASTPNAGKKGNNDDNCEIHVLFPFGSRMEKETISMYFSQFGKVVSCVIPVNKVMNRPKNFCFVRFSERDAVLRALDRKQHKMGEKSIFVTEFVQNKHKSSSRGYGPCGRKQDVPPQPDRQTPYPAGRHSNREPRRESFHDDSYGSWYDDEPRQSSERGDYGRRSQGYDEPRKYSGVGDYDRRSQDYDEPRKFSGIGDYGRRSQGYDEPRHYGSGDGPRSFRSPPRSDRDGYEYVLVKKQPSLPRSRMDDYRDSPVRRSRDYDGYSNRRSPPPTMRGGPMRNRGGSRDRFNPMGRPQQQGRKPGPGSDYKQENKVFIGGLSRSTNSDSLWDYFSKFGEIFDHIVMTHPSGDSKGFGFVTFQKRDSLDICLNSGPHNVDGAEVNVQKAVRNPVKK